MKKKKIRYAVVGIGHIAQVAVLPAFQNAKENSQLTTIFSDDPAKHRFLKKKYGVNCFLYEDYDRVLASGEIDAVYIALPNSMHCDYTLRAAQAGVHVLCEKPMAVTEEECERMIAAAQKNHIKLMIAYRLHFEKANVEVAELAQSGKIGRIRYFNSIFSMQVKRDNIRTDKDLGGGTLYDIGIYCINGVRAIFRAEPYEVFAAASAREDERFDEIEEMVSAVLRFPDQRLAAFTCSFGAADNAAYEVVGTKGTLCLDQSYEYTEPMTLEITVDGKTKTKEFKLRDQFAPELIYFSNCILKNKEPEPSGKEGLADVRIIQALYQSAKQKKPIKLERTSKSQRPARSQVITKPAVEKPEIVHAQAASGGP